MPTRARSRKALLELEKILSLPPCRLVNALPGDAYTLWAAERVVPDNEIVTEVLAGMGLDMERRFTGVVNLDETTIGPDHTEQSVFIQQLLRTEQDGWNRFPLVSQQETELEATPEIEALNGCTLGQVVKVPSARMLVAELLLPRKLARGEVHYTEHRTVYGEGGEPCTNLGRLISNPTDLVVMEVHFQGETPQRLYRRHINADAVEVAVDQELPLAQGRASLVLAPPRLGGHLVEREW